MVAKSALATDSSSKRRGAADTAEEPLGVHRSRLSPLAAKTSPRRTRRHGAERRERAQPKSTRALLATDPVNSTPCPPARRGEKRESPAENDSRRARDRSREFHAVPAGTARREERELVRSRRRWPGLRKSMATRFRKA